MLRLEPSFSAVNKCVKHSINVLQDKCIDRFDNWKLDFQLYLEPTAASDRDVVLIIT